MAILRRTLADADYRGISVLIALEDSYILVGLRKNTIIFILQTLLKYSQSKDHSFGAHENHLKVSRWETTARCCGAFQRAPNYCATEA